MKLITIILLSIFTTVIYAQMNGLTYPNIPSEGTSIEDFVPNNWRIIKSVKSDFNSDGTLDNAVVIQLENSIDSSSFSPKMLLIIFQRPDKMFELNLSTFKLFGVGFWGVQGGEPFNNMELDNENLKITFWTGGTTAVKMEYYFQYIEKEWFLTKYMSTFYEHTSNDLWIDNVDFINKREWNFTKKNGRKITDKKYEDFNLFLKNNNIINVRNKLIDIDIQGFIDPFKG